MIYKLGKYLILVLILTSCMTTSRMNKLVANHYTNKNKTILTSKPNEVFELNYTKLPRINGYCKSEYRAFFTVPLLFYTFSKSKINCSINPKLVGWQFENLLFNWMNTEYIKTKLGANVLELTFNKLPNRIHHTYRSHFILAPTYYTSNISVNDIEFKTDSGEVQLTCLIKDLNGKVLKQLEINKYLESHIINTNYEGRRKHFIYQNLTSYDAKYEMVFRAIIQDIEEEL